MHDSIEVNNVVVYVKNLDTGEGMEFLCDKFVISVWSDVVDVIIDDNYVPVKRLIKYEYSAHANLVPYEDGTYIKAETYDS